MNIQAIIHWVHITLECSEPFTSISTLNYPNSQDRIIIISIVQMRKLGIKEIEYFAQGHKTIEALSSC